MNETKKTVNSNRTLFDSSLPFEKPIVELEKTVVELREHSKEGIDLSDEIKSVEKKLTKQLKEVYDNLSPWQKVQVARHPLRPYTQDYIDSFVDDFVEIHGDRRFSDDKALIAGFGMIEGRKVCVVGHQKGRDTKENLLRMFGSAHPEGYRKAIRVMKLAEKAGLPIVSFIDTPGAYPGIGAEERGQAEAIASNLKDMADLHTPIVAIVIGEGGSGGALGIGVADHVYVMENAYYSVISPEGCAAILWKDNARAPEAAESLKMTAYDLLSLGLIDGVIKEPLGGAHRDFGTTANTLKDVIVDSLNQLSKIPKKDITELRYDKFRKMGVFEESVS